MKNKLIYLSLAALAMMWSGCEDDTTDDVSFVTTYPDLQVEGSSYLVVQAGQPFTDPGVTAKIGDEEVETQVSGAPDTSTPGIYTITYSAVNEDGFSRAVTRTVGVSLEDPNAEGAISGYYDRLGTPTIIIKTDEPNEYYSTNGWGNSTVIPIYFTVNGTNVTIPQQASGFGPVLGSGTVDPGNSITFLMDIPDFDIFGSSRVHIKQ